MTELEKSPLQAEAARRMHSIGGFFMPEIGKMCAAQGFDAVRMTSIMIVVAIEDDRLLACTVMADDRLPDSTVIRIIEVAHANMTGDGDGVSFIREHGGLS